LRDLLAPSGAVALFWNNWHLDVPERDMDAVRRTYQAVAPDLIADLRSPEDVDPWREEIAAGSGLQDARERTYTWSWELATTDYLTLLSSTSQYAVTQQSRREALFAQLAPILGDNVRLQVTTRLHLARRP
jgi:hypothetical protein